MTEIEVLEQEIKELQTRSAELSRRISNAQTAQKIAREKIVEGDAKAPRQAAEAAEIVASLSPALQKVSNEISARQNHIVAIKRAAIHSAKMDDLAGIALRCGAAKQNLQKHFDEAVAAVRAAFVGMDEAREDFSKSKQEFNVALQANVKDFVLRQSAKDASLDTEISQIAKELQQRGASLNDGFTIFCDLWERPVFSSGYAKNVSIIQLGTEARSIERVVQTAFNEKLR